MGKQSRDREKEEGTTWRRISGSRVAEAWEKRLGACEPSVVAPRLGMRGWLSLSAHNATARATTGPREAREARARVFVQTRSRAWRAPSGCGKRVDAGVARWDSVG